MLITLFYRGHLKSNASASAKHRLRMAFEPQLRKRAFQLKRFGGDGSNLEDSYWDNEPPPMKVTRRGEWQFVALSDQHDVMKPDIWPHVELDITLLRPPGENHIATGGDIDNRLKTLLDSLQGPDPNQSSTLSVQETRPCFVLMLNDHQISRISVETRTLLDSTDPKEAVLLIDANIIDSHITHW